MTEMPKEFKELEEDIRHKVFGLVEDHPLARHLPPVAIRNMANCAAWGAIGALTPEEVAAVTAGERGKP